MSKRYPSQQDKRARWDYSLLADSASAQLYELSDAQVNALLAVTSSVMRWRTRWLHATDAQLQAFADTLSYRLMTPVTLPVPRPASDAPAGGLVIIESEDEMPTPLSIEDVNGTSYLRLDCGCGTARYFALSEASVSPDGTPEGPTGSGNLSSAQFPAAQPNPSCYADAAVDYLSQRFYQYVEFVTALSATALDSAFLAADEVLDVFAILSGASNNDPVLEAIRDAGTAALQSSLSANRGAMVTAWQVDGQLSRYELLQWVNRTQFVADGLLLSNAMRYWLANSIIPGYNRDLVLLAQQCATGNVEVPPPGPIGTVSISAGGVNYLIYQPIRDTVTRIANNDPRPTTLTTATAGPVVGIVAEISDGSGASSCGSGNPRYAMDDGGTEVLQGSNMNSGVIGWAITAPSGVAQAIVDAGLVPSWVKDSVTTDTAPAGDIITYAACTSGFIDFRNVWYLVEA